MEMFRNGVLTTGNVGQGALGRRNPQVGRSCVEDDFEGLRRVTQGDLAEILSLFANTHSFICSRVHKYSALPS